jgi:uncharacterized protein DUF3738
MGPCVRALLEQRFAFKTQLEKREMSVYVLSALPSGATLRAACRNNSA